MFMLMDTQFPICVAIVLLAVGITLLLFKMSPTPNFKEEFRKQREQLMAFDQGGSRKKIPKRKEKKQERREKGLSLTSKDEQNGTTKDHVDFSKKIREIRVIEQDAPPELEPREILSNNVVAKPILLHPGEAKNVSAIHSAVNGNSFDSTMPKDEIELRHVKMDAIPKIPTIVPTPGTEVRETAKEQVAPKSMRKDAGNRRMMKDYGISSNSNNSGLFSKRDLRKLMEQVENNELPPDTEDLVQLLIDALLNHQSEEEGWKCTKLNPTQILKKELQEKEMAMNQLKYELDRVTGRSEENHREGLSLKLKIKSLSSTIVKMDEIHKEDLLRYRSELDREKIIVLRDLETMRQHKEESERQRIFLENSLRESFNALSRLENEHKVEKGLCQEVVEVRELNERLKEQFNQMAQELETERGKKNLCIQQKENEIKSIQKRLEDSQQRLTSAENDVIVSKSIGGDLSRLQSDYKKLVGEHVELRNKNNLLQNELASLKMKCQREEQLGELLKISDSRSKEYKAKLLESLAEPERSKLEGMGHEEFLVNYAVKLEKLSTKHSEGISPRSNEEHCADPIDCEDCLGSQEELRRLQSENAHYSRVLSQTEKMLQDLQEVVEMEEAKWTEVRSEFDVERSVLKSELGILENTVRTLELRLRSTEVEKEVTRKLLLRAKDEIANLTGEVLQKPGETEGIAITTALIEPHSDHAADETIKSIKNGKQERRKKNNR